MRFKVIVIGFLENKCKLLDYGTIPSHEVDIRSCLQFVLDLFGQWVLPSVSSHSSINLTSINYFLLMHDF